MDAEIREQLLYSFEEKDIETVYKATKWYLLDWRTLEQAVADGDRDKAVGAIQSLNAGDFV